MNPASRNTILFDLDGTLIDHFRAIHQSFAYAARQLDLEPPSYDKVRTTVGGSLPVTSSRLYGEDFAEEALVHFHEHFQEIFLDELDALPGALQLLQQLHEQDFNPVVFTNKNGDAARAVCDHLGFTPYLRLVAGANDTPYRKPQPEFSRWILDKLNIDNSQALLVGDSPFDIEAGACVNIPVYCVATGSHTVEELMNHTPAAEAVFPDLATLGQHLFLFPNPKESGHLAHTMIDSRAGRPCSFASQKNSLENNGSGIPNLSD